MIGVINMKIINNLKKQFSNKIFITGDMGKLGKIVRDKLEKNNRVVGYDFARNKSENLLNETNLLKKMKGCKIVVHLAAIPHPHPDHNFDDYFKTNVVGTFNVLKAAHANKVTRFIYISSTAYYGCNTEGKVSPLYFPIDELHPPASRPGITDGKLSAYGQSKVMAEELCSFYGTNKIFETIVLRSGPANELKDQYYEGFDWKTNKSYQRDGFWVINQPENLANAVTLAVNTKKRYKFEVFNVMNKFTPKIVNVKEFLKNEYPTVKIGKLNISKNPSLFSTEKIEKELGFKSVDFQ